MVERKWKIRKNGILVEKAARVYYTHKGVSQRSEKLQCDTPFLMGKSESSLVLFCFPVANLLSLRSTVKILI